MKIAIICEGETERAFLEHLRAFLQTRLAGRMPKLDPVPYDGRIPRADRLRRLPHWREIQKLAAHNRAAPSGQPESVNHLNPPAARIKEVFRTGNRGRAYVKPRDAGRILRGQDLTVAALACPELKAFLNTILTLCGGSLI